MLLKDRAAAFHQFEYRTSRTQRILQSMNGLNDKDPMQLQTEYFKFWNDYIAMRKDARVSVSKLYKVVVDVRGVSMSHIYNRNHT